MTTYNDRTEIMIVPFDNFWWGSKGVGKTFRGKAGQRWLIRGEILKIGRSYEKKNLSYGCSNLHMFLFGETVVWIWYSPFFTRHGRITDTVRNILPKYYMPEKAKTYIKFFWNFGIKKRSEKCPWQCKYGNECHLYVSHLVIFGARWADLNWLKIRLIWFDLRKHWLIWQECRVFDVFVLGHILPRYI